MRGIAIFIVALLVLLVWDWQANGSRYSDAFVRMATDIKRNVTGR